MKEQDKKEIILLMSEAIDQLVLPQLSDIGNDVKDIKGRLGKVENRLDSVENTAEDIQLTVNRIEVRQNAEVRRVDNHEVRISHLEAINK